MKLDINIQTKRLPNKSKTRHSYGGLEGREPKDIKCNSVSETERKSQWVEHHVSKESKTTSQNDYQTYKFVRTLWFKHTPADYWHGMQNKTMSNGVSTLNFTMLLKKKKTELDTTKS